MLGLHIFGEKVYWECIQISNFKFKIRGVNHRELTFIVIVLGLVGGFSYFNFQKSYIRARDVQRKNDLKHIATALSSYQYDFGYYPPSREGKILACGSFENLRTCEWGADTLRDISDLEYPPYIATLPNDPHQSRNLARYKYISNTQNFQLYASLESKNDAEYNENVVSLNLDCGGRMCNFRVTSDDKIQQLIDEIEGVLDENEEKK